MPELQHFPDEQAEDIRREIQFYLRPFIRRTTIIAVTVICFLVIGAAASVYFYGRANSKLTQHICQTSKHVRTPLATYIGTAIGISKAEEKLNLPILQDPRLKPLVKKQDKAIHKLYRALIKAQNEDCSTHTT